MRKLEFLMAEAVKRGHDSVITIGGIQSNHCRLFIVIQRVRCIGTYMFQFTMGLHCIRLATPIAAIPVP